MVKFFLGSCLLLLVAVAFHDSSVSGFVAPVPSSATHSATVLRMGLFDGISKAFSNADFKGQDQRVRASHILIKGDDIDQVLSKIKTLSGEINERSQKEPLNQVFSEVARRESMCSSASQGGDLGQFSPKKMVPEFDEVLFPASSVGPPPGALLGPVVTEFGCHIILVTQRDENKDQVEEKLARIDPDAQ
jgi:parvulin-like peptidyl-prolyl isomerase